MTADSRRRLRVLHARVLSGTWGGPDKTILNSPRFLEDRGYSQLCCYLRHPADPHFRELERLAARWQAPLVAVDDYGPLDWRLPGRLARICRDQRPMIWHGHDYKSNLLGLLLARTQPMRLITTVHGWVKQTWKTGLYYAIDRLCIRRYEHVICVSRDLYQRCLRSGVAAERCTYLPNAVDTDDFSRRETSDSAKARLGVAAGRLVVGAVGRLSREKGFHHLIRAFSELGSERFDAELWIVGEGDQHRELAGLIRRLECGDRIRLLGFRSEISSLYHAMDVFALSSVREGLPNVLLEAMALEIPVVATRVAGVPDLIVDGVSGLLVEPGSSTALAAGLGRLLEDGALRRRLALAARSAIETSHGFRQRMERIGAIYDRALGLGV